MCRELIIIGGDIPPQPVSRLDTSRLVAVLLEAFQGTADQAENGAGLVKWGRWGLENCRISWRDGNEWRCEIWEMRMQEILIL